MEEERIALFVDFENLAISVREALGGMEFDFEPIGNALAERAVSSPARPMPTGGCSPMPARS